MRSYTEAEICLLLLYALPGEPLRETLYRKLFLAYSALGTGAEVENRDLQEQDLMRLGCNRETAKQILYRLEQQETLYSYLRNLRSRGIQVVTRLSPDYPQALRGKLGDRAPLVLYCAGNTELFSTECISLVGSRRLREKGKAFAARAGDEIAREGRTYCSGGAVGADSVGFYAAMKAKGCAVLFLADSLERAMDNGDFRKPLAESRLLLVSEFGYDQGFSTQRALSRNRLIHAMGEKTLVAQSDYGSGGTWNGTLENLRQGWSPVFMCNEEPEDGGTQGLIQRGAVPILTKELSELPLVQAAQLTMEGSL